MRYNLPYSTVASEDLVTVQGSSAQSTGYITSGISDRKTTEEEVMNANCSPRSSISEALFHKELPEHYTVLKELGNGTYGKAVLAKCHQTKEQVALKILPKSSTKLKDFVREFNFSYYLSPHRHILDTFDVAFETTDSFVFAQEHAPCGDLFEAITPQVGLPESQAKYVAKQVASALEFMHSKQLVHRDLKPENVLIFDEKLNRVKLMDFGMTRKCNTMVRKVSSGIPYTPPEICEALKGERYAVDCSADVWAFGVLIFCCLTGNFPWELAHIKDNYYLEYIAWQKRKTVKIPSQWRRFTPRMLRLFRRILDPKLDKRGSVKEIYKYLDDDWLYKPKQDEDIHELYQDDDAAMAELTAMLESHGIETKVNKNFQEKRISEWILSTTP